MSQVQQGGVLTALIWMILISLLLFWLPLLGPLIAGVVGGKKAGGVGNAILAALLPALVLGVFLFFVASGISGIPLIGIVAGAGGFIYAVSGIGPLLVGALIGGILA